MVSIRQITQALCLLSTLSLGEALVEKRAKGLGFSKVSNPYYVHHALRPRQSGCGSGNKLCPFGDCALASDECCDGGGACHPGYNCYGVGDAGGCCPDGQTCSGPGVGCTGTDVECSDGCYPAGTNCNGPVINTLTTTSSGATPTGGSSGCLSSEKTCGANYCIPSDAVCCGDGYYCDAGRTCTSDGAGNYKCPLGGSSGVSSLDFGSFTSSFASTFGGVSPTGSGSTPTSDSFSFLGSNTGSNPTATGGITGATPVNGAPSMNANVYGGLAGLVMVFFGL